MLQTMISATFTRASKKLMTVTRAAVIVVLSCAFRYVVPSWLVAVGSIII